MGEKISKSYLACCETQFPHLSNGVNGTCLVGLLRKPGIMFGYGVSCKGTGGSGKAGLGSWESILQSEQGACWLQLRRWELLKDF